ncbi:hypothetical protein GE061_009262 [Apolygus lucorum]|uniref:Pro-resilin-like n=1 Tax=Apolygus lucorum TaxID=248454 RepID=A0A8S9Y154_APOLU|nr:hypothetical protein GE061_009262 [Apolygus lucorum]
MTSIKLAVLGVLVAAVAAEPPVYHHNDVGSSYGVPQADYSGYEGGGHYSGGYSGGGYDAGYSGGYSGGNSGGYDHHHEEHHEAKPYEFGYAVKDHHHGTDFGQQETSDGHNVKGSYRVLLPDGRVQIVTYHADWKTGFHADVKYEGEAHYPEPQHQGNQGGYHYPEPQHQGNQGGYHYPAPAHSDYSGGDLGGQGYSHGGYKR